MADVVDIRGELTPRAVLGAVLERADKMAEVVVIWRQPAIEDDPTLEFRTTWSATRVHTLMAYPTALLAEVLQDVERNG